MDKFYKSDDGQKFFKHFFPKFVSELTRLNENLEKMQKLEERKLKRAIQESKKEE